MIKLHMFPLGQSGLNNLNDNTSHASNSAIRIEQSVYKRYRQSKILHEHTRHAFINIFRFDISFTKVTNEAKSYMNTPHFF